jgi:hypothetical protein
VLPEVGNAPRRMRRKGGCKHYDLIPRTRRAVVPLFGVLAGDGVAAKHYALACLR